MAYYQEKRMSCTPGGSAANYNEVTYGDLTLIDRAVTLDGIPSDLANPKIKLAADGDIILGSIRGFAQNKVQVAVTGWDLKFINGTTSALTLHGRIVGATVGSGTTQLRGYVQDATPVGGTYSQSNLNNHLDGRGNIVHTGVAGVAGQEIVRVGMIFGA